MMKLPDSLVVDRDHKLEADMLAKAKAKLEAKTRSPGLHASDLLEPRQAYWSRVMPMPLNNREIKTFILGHTHHELFLGAFDTGTRHSGKIGVDYSVDEFLNPDTLQPYTPFQVADYALYPDGNPCEFKTSRHWKTPRDVEDLQKYLEQLLIYMVAENKTTGHIKVVYMCPRAEKGKPMEPEFRAYTVTVNQVDLDELRYVLIDTRNTLDDVIQDGSDVYAGQGEAWRELPMCTGWLCKRNMCRWYDACKPEGLWKP